jgi:putative DNA primase/helicase
MQAEPSRGLAGTRSKARLSNGFAWRNYSASLACRRDAFLRGAAMMNAESIAKALDGQKASGGWKARCPAHDDRTPSLSISEKDGKPLFCCHAGCSQDAIIDALRDRGLWPKHRPNGKAKEVRRTTFDFRDPHTGKTAYRKIRIEYEDGDKTLFFQPKGRGGSAPLLYGAERLADLTEGQPVWIVEGEKMVERLRGLGAVAVSGDTGESSKWLPAYAELLRGIDIVLWPDSDEVGENYIASAAKCLNGHAARLRVVRPFGRPNGAKGLDVCDWNGGPDDLKALVATAEPYAVKGAFDTFDGASDSSFSQFEWPEPKPLPDGLLPVAAFEQELLPQSVAPWVLDIADRMQCPADFVAIAVMVALGSVIGRKIGIRPQRKTDWIEVPNLWGCIVGRPGVLKSPAMTEALKPLHRLEADARKEHESVLKTYEREADYYKIAKDEASKKVRKGDKRALDGIDAPEEPKARRYIVNDTSYESLGQILADNPNGVLVFRDELVSLLKTLDREEYVAARGFYLSAWNGTGGYTFDRITRGKTHIDGACISLLGSTQPGRLAEYISKAMSGGASDDGLIQRFNLLVWPDQSGEWKEIDQYPDSESRIAAWNTFYRLSNLEPAEVGAQRDEYEAIPFLRFDDRAQIQFSEWRADLEKRLRGGEIGAALESHFAKYRTLVPALALINHLADGGTGSIGERAILRALAFSEYLETHAKRAYHAGLSAEISAAKAILKRIRKGDLKDGFTLREAMWNHWADLTDRDQVLAGLNLLCDLNWLGPDKVQTGGRPTTTYAINPRVSP